LHEENEALSLSQLNAFHYDIITTSSSSSSSSSDGVGEESGEEHSS
jgi:hypothetical protein